MPLQLLLLFFICSNHLQVVSEAMILPLPSPHINKHGILSKPLSFKGDSSVRPLLIPCRNNGTIITFIAHWRGLSLTNEYGLMTVLLLFAQSWSFSPVLNCISFYLLWHKSLDNKNTLLCFCTVLHKVNPCPVCVAGTVC